MKERVLVIGLDGVPYSLLLSLAQKGIMPATSKLIDSGHIQRMKASLPEISAVSWTNFMTGTNPGTHGIFGFTDFKRDSYDLCFPNFLDLKKETFWDILGDQRKRCVVINQPSTYPARKINAIELSKAVYPPSLQAPLERIGYEIDIDTQKSRENAEFLWKDLADTLSARRKAFDLLWKEDWDYFEFVITGTDRLHHFQWDAYEDENHVYHQNFLAYYGQIDRVIDEIVTSFLKLTDDDKGLYLLSDHGFAQIEQEVYLNAWLEEQGYLSFNNPSPESLADISPSSRAFVMEPNRVSLKAVLNHRGKTI
jgi:predicted AlkP superfamily phosphohydrolase/phosphomutase